MAGQHLIKLQKELSSADRQQTNRLSETCLHCCEDRYSLSSWALQTR